MARGRMLSKEISLDEKVNALSDDSARLLFTWMIPHLDREGRLYAEPEVFKSIVAPRRNFSTKKVEKYLTEMEKLQLIFRYNVNGNAYLFAPNFEKHQTGLRKDREAQSKIPPPPPELVRSNDGINPAQVKDKFKYKYKDKDNIIMDSLTFRNEEGEKIWRNALKKISGQVSKVNFNSWYKATTGLHYEAGVFFIGVPRPDIGDHLQKHQRSLIEKTLCDLIGEAVRVEFVLSGNKG